MTKQATSQFGGKQHRHLAGRHRTRTQTPNRPFSSTPTNQLGAFQALSATVHVIPVVTLHLPGLLGNHHAAQAVPAAGVAADEAVTVAIDPAALVTGQAAAIGIADARIMGKRCGLALQGQLDGLLRLDRPGMVKIQVGQLAGHQRRVGQASAVILAGMLGNRQRGGHGFANGLCAAGRGARRTFALP